MAQLFSDPMNIGGVLVWPEYLSKTRQNAILEDIRMVATDAPLRFYETPGGHKMSVAMTAAGALGWTADRGGYRYREGYAEGEAWPEIPASILAVWHELAGVDAVPDSCLVNYYGEGARMGLHQDKDEATLDWPVLSISLGDDALFRVGGLDRKSPTQSIWLKSGDVALLSGPARAAFHGIDRIKYGTSDLLRKGGRLNLTLRVAGQGAAIEQHPE